MIASGLPPRYFGATVYTKNRLPRIIEKGIKSPYELLYGYPSPIHKLRIFGCTAFVRVAHRAPDKSETRAEKGIFLGYDDESRAYRVWIPTRQTTIISRDVKFKEAEKGIRSEKGTKTKSKNHFELLEEESDEDKDEEIKEQEKKESDTSPQPQVETEEEGVEEIKHIDADIPSPIPSEKEPQRKSGRMTKMSTKAHEALGNLLNTTEASLCYHSPPFRLLKLSSKRIGEQQSIWR